MHKGNIKSVQIKNEPRGQRRFTKHKPHAGRVKGQKMPFFVPGDIDLKTRPSEGPNTSSV